MRHDFAARPLHRFNENAIMGVFHHRTTAGTFVLQTARDLYRGAVCMVAAGDVKQALLDTGQDPSDEASRWWQVALLAVSAAG